MSGASELRVKESDRITALVAGFRAMGVAADERPVIDESLVRAAEGVECWVAEGIAAAMNRFN